jgi:hypothetical protein
MYHASNQKAATIVINHLKDGAAGYIIHAITFSFVLGGGGAEQFTINGENLVTLYDGAGVPQTHRIEHVVIAKSLNIKFLHDNDLITVHYQYFTHEKLSSPKK